MRAINRSNVAMPSMACLAVLTACVFSSSAFAQSKPSPQPAQAAPAQEAPAPKQIALTAKQVEGVLAAKNDVDAIIAKLPEDALDKPDPKVQAQLDGAVKKYGFASYAEYDDVTANIGLVLAGFDPQTKKFVGPAVVIKQQIAEVQADKQMSAKDKKEALDELKESLTSVVPIQIPGNIDLVGKYYDKLSDALQSDQ